MAELEQVREREPEPRLIRYDDMLEYFAQMRQKLARNKVVVKSKEAFRENNRQGRFTFLLMPDDMHQGRACVPHWSVFVHEVHTAADGTTTSGQHRHQGGLGLFALEGEGYTVVDGVRYDWEAGDFIMLPIKPGGCLHQHFSRRPDKPARWLAMIYHPYQIITGMAFEQTKDGVNL